MINITSILKIGFISLMLLVADKISAQHIEIENNKTSIKQLKQRVYKVKVKNGALIKGKPTVIFDNHPIKNYNVKKAFNKLGQLVNKKLFDYCTKYAYNSRNKPIKIVQFHPNMIDSLVVNYTYDDQMNIENISYKKTEGTVSFLIGLSWYDNLIDKNYINTYKSKDDTFHQKSLNKNHLKLHKTYRLYDTLHNLIEEKYLFISKRLYSKKIDSTIYKNQYEYNHLNLLKKTTKTIQHTPDLFIKNNKTKSWITFKYNQLGKLVSTAYYNQNKPWPYIQKFYTYNNNENLKIMTYCSGKKFKKSYFLEYKYDTRNNWIQCIHYNEKRKPLYWVERDIVYFNAT